MASFATRARDLVKEISNYEPDRLPPYNEELVRLALNEIREHDSQAQRVLREGRQRANGQQDTGGSAQSDQTQDPEPADAVALVIHLESIARSKKLLLSYMLQRFNRLKYIRWEHRRMPASVEPMCSQQEAEVYKTYDRILTQYMSQGTGIGHDLTLDCDPPRDNTVCVWVVRDAGTHLFSFGTQTLTAGALLRLPGDEAEPFIKAGVLKLHDRADEL